MASPNTADVAAGFRFMDLPLEVRRYFYRLILPSQTISMRNNACAAIEGTPNEFMNLLVASRQVSDEARRVLYGSNSFTVTVSGDTTDFLGLEDRAKWFRPFLARPMPSLNYIKNWQFRLIFHRHWDQYPSDIEMMQRDRRWLEEGLLAVASELARITDLQTLKIFIPCICNRPSAAAVNQLYETTMSSLKPVQKQLRFSSVQVVTAVAPSRVLNASGEFAGWSHWFGSVLCTKPKCITFAQSFSPIKDVLQGSLTPTSLTPRQIAWLDIKVHASLVPPPSTKRIRCALYDLWKLVDVKTPGPFYKEIQVTKKIIDDELKGQYQKGKYQRNEVVRYSGSWWRQTPLEDLKKGALSITGGPNPSTGPRARAECQRWGRR
ncbi:MAG: hypothetical protein LQ346_003489 [Caloplaca aetnensis]|nr:MAG: hypothetical protein LQ346_003489 [Caloplaca aetnensis]